MGSCSLGAFNQETTGLTNHGAVTDKNLNSGAVTDKKFYNNDFFTKGIAPPPSNSHNKGFTLEVPLKNNAEDKHQDKSWLDDWV